MTTPRGNWSARGLQGLAESMWGQESVSIGGALLLRLARYLGGDPAQWLTLTSAPASPQGLPDNVAAMSAILHVTGNACQIRDDGTNPLATDPVLQPGAVITVTGRPSIISFRFVTTGPSNCVLVGSYYD